MIRHLESRILAKAAPAVVRGMALAALKGNDLVEPTAADLADYAERAAWIGYDFGQDMPYHSLMLGKGPLAVLKVVRGECAGLLRLKTGPKFLLQLVEDRELQGKDAFLMFRRGVTSLLREVIDLWEPCTILARAYGLHEETDRRQLIHGYAEADAANERWEVIRGLFPEEEVPLKDVRTIRSLRLAVGKLRIFLRPLHDVMKVQARLLETEEFTINRLVKSVNWTKKGGAGNFTRREFSKKFINPDHFAPNFVKTDPTFFTTRGLAEAIEQFIKFASRI